MHVKEVGSELHIAGVCGLGSGDDVEAATLQAFSILTGEYKSLYFTEKAIIPPPNAPCQYSRNVPFHVNTMPSC